MVMEDKWVGELHERDEVAHPWSRDNGYVRWLLSGVFHGLVWKWELKVTSNEAMKSFLCRVRFVRIHGLLRPSRASQTFQGLPRVLMLECSMAWSGSGSSR